MKKWLIFLFCIVVSICCLHLPGFSAENAQETVIVETSEENIDNSPLNLSAEELAPLPAKPQAFVPLPRQSTHFNHLYLFSFGGLVVLFLLWTGMAAGPLWFLLFALAMYSWGWLSLPLSVQTLPIKKIILYFILLKIALYLLGLALKSGINWEDKEDGDTIKSYISLFSTDLIVIVTVLWIVVNGVFIYTPPLGRWVVVILLVCFAMAGRIPLKLGSQIMSLAKNLGCSLGCLPLLRPLYVFLSLWLMSIWL